MAKSGGEVLASWEGQQAPSPPANGFEECCKLPQRGSGQCPNRKRILGALRAQKTHLVAANIIQFLLISQNRIWCILALKYGF